MRISRFEHMDWLRYAGLFTLACVGMPLVIESWKHLSASIIAAWISGGALPESISREEVRDLVGWWVSYAVFGISYWYVTADLGVSKRMWRRLPLLVAMCVAAVAISWFSQSGLSGILLMVIAGVLPWCLPIWVAVIWLIGQNFSLVPIFLALEDPAGEPLYLWFDAILQSFLYLGFSSFTFATSYVTKCCCRMFAKWSVSCVTIPTSILAVPCTPWSKACRHRPCIWTCLTISRSMTPVAPMCCCVVHRKP